MLLLATAIAAILLAQVPSGNDVFDIVLVVTGIALHRPAPPAKTPSAHLHNADRRPEADYLGTPCHSGPAYSVFMGISIGVGDGNGPARWVIGADTGKRRWQIMRIFPAGATGMGKIRLLRPPDVVSRRLK